MLTNPFYYGHFRYLGEVYEGKHTPIISKRLFDDVQNALERRGKPQKAVKEPWPFCGLIHCSCGMMFTNERQVKRQKNGAARGQRKSRPFGRPNLRKFHRGAG